MVRIEIDADLMLVDDEGRYIGHLPADPSRLHVGCIAVAGRPGGYTWALVEEITDTAVYFRAIEVDEAHKHGRLELPTF
ncbi:MAG: hypothetical protein HHJ14_05765 [Cellulomonas sp.]|nr:hypothetical protein [Cellulomonas sp.]